MTKEKKAEKEEKQEGKEVEEEEDSETEAVVTKKDLLELSAKIDKMTDAFSRVADALTAKQEEEEKPKEEEEKQEEDEEEKPEEEEKQEEEEEEEEEKKMQKDEYFKEDEKEKEDSKDSNIDKLIEAKVAEKVKSILGSTVQKRSKKIKKVAVKEQDDLLKIYSTPWSEIHALAKSRGAN